MAVTTTSEQTRFSEGWGRSDVRSFLSFPFQMSRLPHTSEFFGLAIIRLTGVSSAAVEPDDDGGAMTTLVGTQF